VVVAANFLIDSESNLRSAINAFGRRAVPSAAAPTHKGEGSVDAVDFAHASVTLTHGPIASLKWPGMTMDFKVKDPALLRTLKPGQNIAFEFVQAAAGEWTIVRVQPATAKPSKELKSSTESKPAAGLPPADGGHKGH
jgi:Cu(I)/Ag(I) efflux system membrane fusion protein